MRTFAFEKDTTVYIRCPEDANDEVLLDKFRELGKKKKTWPLSFILFNNSPYLMGFSINYSR